MCRESLTRGIGWGKKSRVTTFQLSRLPSMMPMTCIESKHVLTSCITQFRGNLVLCHFASSSDTLALGHIKFMLNWQLQWFIKLIDMSSFSVSILG